MPVAPARPARPEPRKAAKPARPAQLASEIGAAIACARRRIWGEAEARLSERGESMLVFSVLNHLERLGPCSQNELAQAIAQHPTGLSRLLEELDADGLVTRQRDPADRRRVRVDATRRGRALLAGGRPAVTAAVEQALHPLLPAERESLRALLRKLLGSS